MWFESGCHSPCRGILIRGLSEQLTRVGSKCMGVLFGGQGEEGGGEWHYSSNKGK